MTYLIDANVLSEPTRSSPRAEVLEWLRDHEREMAVDPVILGEVRYGIYLLAAGAKKRRLERWFVNGVGKIRCLSWDAPTGLRWAKLLADLSESGGTMPIKDSLIAATALAHNLTLVTHNTRDFLNAGVKIFDPYES